MTVLLLLVALADHARAAEPQQKLVILLPESMRLWIPKLEESAKHPLSNSWPVRAHHPDPANGHRPEMQVVYQVGKAVADAKDASMVIQFANPKAYMKARTPTLDVPFTIYDIPTAGGKPVEVAKGVVSRGGNSYESAAEILAMGGLRSIEQSLRIDGAQRVFADKPTLAQNEGGIFYQYAPVTFDKAANPPVARVKVRNQYPVSVLLALRLQSKTALVRGDQHFTFECPEIPAGEAKTIEVPLGNLKPGQEPQWAQLGFVLLVDPPAKK